MLEKDDKIVTDLDLKIASMNLQEESNYYLAKLHALVSVVVFCTALYIGYKISGYFFKGEK